MDLQEKYYFKIPDGKSEQAKKQRTCAYVVKVRARRFLLKDVIIQEIFQICTTARSTSQDELGNKKEDPINVLDLYYGTEHNCTSQETKEGIQERFQICTTSRSTSTSFIAPV